MVTLVHGTWASEASWTRQDSPLRRLVHSELGDQVDVRVFPWSGRNTHTHRLRAAEGLREELKTSHAQNPGVKQFVVAHSHGGNIACYALQDAALRSAVDGVICLATPFLHVHRSRLPRSLLFTALLFLLCCGFFGVSYLFYRPRASVMTYVMIGGLAVFALVCVLSVTALLCGRDKTVGVAALLASARDSEGLVGALWLPPLGADRFVAVRVTGDEAAGALGTSQFFVWVFRLAWSTLAPIWEAFDRLRGRSTGYLGLAFGGLTVAAWLALISKEVSGAITGGVMLLVAASGIVTFAVGLVAFLILALILLVHSPFGIDTVLASLDLQTTAEPSPPGQALVYHITPENHSPGAGRDLRHSSIYEDPRVLCFITEWIRARLGSEGHEVRRGRDELGGDRQADGGPR